MGHETENLIQTPRGVSAKEKDANRPWRTNIGLRLTQELGLWVERRCKDENRTFANYVETLIIKDRASDSAGAKPANPEKYPSHRVTGFDCNNTPGSSGRDPSPF